MGKLDSYVRLLRDNSRLLSILAIIALFIIIVIYIYRSYVIPKLKPSYVANKEFHKSEDAKVAEVYYFFADWCPHCKSARPHWDRLKGEFEIKQVNGYKLHFIEVDCTDSESVRASEMMDKYKVEGFPTIKLKKDGKVIEYNAKPNFETMSEFLHKMM
jgi:thiol-disulfide isomerase/thioredoxin